MLQNSIYRGQIVHRDKCYPGLHDAIIDETLWDEVQTALADNRVERVTRSHASAPSLLAGLVYDGSGDRMSPTHANRTGKRYRYYVSQSLIKRGRPKASDAACRVPAADLEAIVQERICTMLGDEAAILDASGTTSISGTKALIEQAADLALRWPRLPATDRRAMLHVLVDRIDVHAEAVGITVRPAAIAGVVKSGSKFGQLSAPTDAPTTVLSVPAHVRRTGTETRLLIQGAVGAGRRVPDRSLLRLIGQARRFHDMVIKQSRQNHHRSRERSRRHAVLVHPSPASELPRTGRGCHGNPAMMPLCAINHRCALFHIDIIASLNKSSSTLSGCISASR